MYARTNTVIADPQAIDESIAYIRDEVMPLVQGMDGCIGLSMLADRDSGRCIVTTAWRTEEAMHASEAGVRASRERAGQIFGGMPEVKEYEIAVMHRMHETGDGARTRVIWGTTEPAQMDDMLSSWRMSMLPKVEALPGFASCTILVDRATGRTAMTVTYDSGDAMRQASERAAQLRQEAPTMLGLTDRRGGRVRPRDRAPASSRDRLNPRPGRCDGASGHRPGGRISRTLGTSVPVGRDAPLPSVSHSLPPISRGASMTAAVLSRPPRRSSRRPGSRRRTCPAAPPRSATRRSCTGPSAASSGCSRSWRAGPRPTTPSAPPSSPGTPT